MQIQPDNDDPGTAPIDALCAMLAGKPAECATAIGACLVRFDEAAPILRADLARAADGLCTTEEEAQRVFTGLHILAGGRDTTTFPILLRLLRRPIEELDWLLGDAATETLSRIAASVYDGDADALFGAIGDPEIDDFIRDSLMGAAAFLTWDGRIELAATTRFLERFDDERMAVDGEFVWSSWEAAIALLGLRPLAPRVERALADGRIDLTIAGLDHFPALLARAEAEPQDGARFSSENLGYVEDVIETLLRFRHTGAEEPDEDFYRDPEDDALYDRLFGTPTVNPLRHVGRNDPCPCGSGKKFKKCCLAEA